MIVSSFVVVNDSTKGDGSKCTYEILLEIVSDDLEFSCAKGQLYANVGRVLNNSVKQ